MIVFSEKYRQKHHIKREQECDIDIDIISQHIDEHESNQHIYKIRQRTIFALKPSRYYQK